MAKTNKQNSETTKLYSTNGQMQQNLLELTFTIVFIPARPPQISKYHTIARSNSDNQIPGDLDTLYKNKTKNDRINGSFKHKC